MKIGVPHRQWNMQREVSVPGGLQLAGLSGSFCFLGGALALKRENTPRHSYKGNNWALSLARRGGESPPREDCVLYEVKKMQKNVENLSKHQRFLMQVLKSNPSEFWNSELFSICGKSTLFWSKMKQPLKDSQISFSTLPSGFLAAPGLDHTIITVTWAGCASSKVPEPRDPANGINECKWDSRPQRPGSHL